MVHWLGSVSILNHGVISNLGSAKVCSAIFETYFSYHTDIWIAELIIIDTLIVLFPLIDIL